MSEADLLAALNDISAPSGAAGGMAGDLLAALAVALVLAFLMARALTPFLRRHGTPPPPEVESANPEVRKLALMRRLKAVAPEQVDAFRDALYRPDVPLDEAALRRILDARGKGAGRA